jgi:hypothetical protein
MAVRALKSVHPTEDVVARGSPRGLPELGATPRALTENGNARLCLENRSGSSLDRAPANVSRYE